MQIKRNERGRSMVEILGVLALIGLLSIGGIAGYQYAYSSYQAGQIQDVIGKAKLLATQNNRSSRVKEVRRFVENMLSKYKPADTTPMVTHRDGKYIVDLFNVSDSVCEKLQNRRDIFNSMQIGMIPEACTTAEMNMQFTFDSIVIGGSGVNGSGDSYDNPIERCPDKQVWRQKEDGTYGCVCRHEYEYGEDCTRCEPPRSWNTGNQSCQCPADKPIWEYGVCKCIADTDCQYSGTGFCCDDMEQVCRQCDETDCDKTKGLTLADGRCVCSGRKEWRQDEGESEPSCKCPVNTPPEADSETCECPDGKDNVDEDGDGINECVTSCPSDTGFTGLRNRTTGNCLCNTGAGYKAESETVGGIQMCVCDETRDYYQGPSGCLPCLQVTKEFAQKNWGSDDTVGLNIDTVDEDVWWCRYSVDHTYVFNPSENRLCGKFEVLKKDSNGKFYCSADCSASYGSGMGIEGGKWISFGICGCYYYSVWENNRCINPCSNGQKINGQCSKCYETSYTFDGTTCHVCNNGIPAPQEGACMFTYRNWLANTPAYCHPNANDGISGRYNQTQNGDCSYEKGISIVKNVLPYCEFNTKITTDCRCSINGDIGQYCCSASTYPTSTGCATCPMGYVPNSMRTGCTECPKNTITQDGKCVKCDKGYYPSSQQNRCLACPADRTTDEDGLTCSVCVDSNKIFNMITNRCECPPEISFEDPINGSCIFFEDENTEEGESN